MITRSDITTSATAGPDAGQVDGSAAVSGTSGFLGGVRLRLEPTRSRRAMLDGAWWPYATDLLAQLPALVRALDVRGGSVTHLMLGAALSADHPRRLFVDGRRVRLGWFASQSPALLIAISGTRDRTDLLVIPPSVPPASAERAMTAASDASSATSMLRAADLLAASDTPTPADPAASDTATWESEGGRVPASVF